MKAIVIQSVFAGMLVLSGCTPSRPPLPPKTQLEMREMQTRNYENKDMKLAMKAVINALQDEGFLVKNADKELGFISATKEFDVENGTERFFAILSDGAMARYKKNTVIEASANVSDFGRETKVRVIFQTKILDNFGGAVSVHQIDDSGYYQEFFSKVDKSLYFERERL